MDYTSFGSLLPGRKWEPTSTDKYRFGFNGKEMDDENKTQDYGARIYSSLLGRFLSVDPLTKSFVMLSTYQFASNCPIWAIDLDGKEAQVAPPPIISVIIVVLEAKDIQNDYNGQVQQTVGNSVVFTATDIETAYTLASNYLGNQKVDNLVIDIHGSIEDKGKAEESKVLITSYSPKTWVNRYDLHDNKNKNSLQNATTGKEEKINDVQALKAIFGLVKIGGNIIVDGCEIGEDDFTSGLYNLAPAQLKCKMFVNQDLSRPAIVVDGNTNAIKSICFQGGPSLNKGWVIWTSLGSQSVKNDFNTGDIQVSTTNNLTPIIQEKEPANFDEWTWTPCEEKTN